MTPGQKAAATRARNLAAQLEQRAQITGLCVRVGADLRAATRDEILEAAAAYLKPEHIGRPCTTPREAIELFRPIVCGRQHETFAIAYLNARHNLLDVEALFHGTINGATVYPREVVRKALQINAHAVMIAHNHPSGGADPSEADHNITRKLQTALAVVEIRLLDHIVLTNTTHVSLAERGLI